MIGVIRPGRPDCQRCLTVFTCSNRHSSHVNTFTAIMFLWQNKTKQNKAKQNKTKQNKTKQNKAKQNKTKRNKTKRNKTKRNETKQNETKRNETKQNKAIIDSCIYHKGDMLKKKTSVTYDLVKRKQVKEGRPEEFIIGYRKSNSLTSVSKINTHNVKTTHLQLCTRPAWESW